MHTMSPTAQPLTLTLAHETWQMTAPLRISTAVLQEARVIVATLSDGSFRGRGEAVGVFYRGEDPDTMTDQIEAVRAAVEAGVSRTALRDLMPPGGARNAIDCALWELESMRAGRDVCELAGVGAASPLLTTCTIGADTPQAMAKAAAETFRNAKALKLKILGDGLDAARLGAVRSARPDVWLGVDANQGYDLLGLEALLPQLVEMRVALIEQPLRVGEEHLLARGRWPIPVAADESVQSLKDVASAVGHFDAINIKLDKCGGLTEALLMAAEARRLGLRVMVGNMGGTSLAMAPALVVGQRCDIVDLDGPLFLTADRAPAIGYRHGLVSAGPGVWGWSAAS